MRFEPIEIKDKKGRTIILRSAEISDVDDLITYLKVTATETPFLLREPDEVNITKEQEESFIKAVMDADKELMLIATVDGVHVGNCSLMRKSSYKRHSHRCEVAIALYQEFCGVGIGEIMLQMVLDVAKQLGYEQAELEVISDNVGAIALYKKLGFEKYGCFPDSMKYNDGRYVGADWMMKKLM